MSGITYKAGSYGSVIVYLNGKKAGTIRKLANGYQYTPRGARASLSGDVMPTLSQVKTSLEDD